MYLQNFLRMHGITKVNGILADLGVSSHQFDTGERGFSIRFEGDLDMRMNMDAPLTAAKVVNKVRCFFGTIHFCYKNTVLRLKK